MPSFSLTYEWLPEPEDGQAFGPDRVTWASLRAEVDGLNVTAHHDAESVEYLKVRDAVNGGLAGIADWLVENWLYVFWEVHTPFPKIASTDGAAGRVPSLRDALEGYPSHTGSGASPAPLARWQHRHSLGHAASDLALPSIVFLPE